MNTLRIDPGFKGPTIVELAPLVSPGQDGPIEVRWGNSKEEKATLRRLWYEAEFTLVVADLKTMSLSALALGLPVLLSEELLASVRNSLNTVGGPNWRQLSSTLTPQISRDALLRLASNAVRKGNNSMSLRRVALDCLVNKVSSTDAEVLLDLARSAAA